MPANVPADPPSVADLAALNRDLADHKDRLLALIRRKVRFPLRTVENAEDLLHSAIAVAYKRWPEYRKQTALTFTVWLYLLVKDEIAKAFRADGRDPNQQMPSDASQVLGDRMAARDAGPRTAAEAAERAALVRQIVDGMSEVDREILELRYVEQFAPAEIAVALGIDPNAVYAREFRALKRFKAAWTKLAGPPESTP